MRWVGHVELRNVYTVSVGRPEKKRPRRNLGIDGRIMLE
jgi:hypothetical protein